MPANQQGRRYHVQTSHHCLVQARTQIYISVVSGETTFNPNILVRLHDNTVLAYILRMVQDRVIVTIIHRYRGVPRIFGGGGGAEIHQRS